MWDNNFSAAAAAALGSRSVCKRIYGHVFLFILLNVQITRVFGLQITEHNEFELTGVKWSMLLPESAEESF